LGKIGVEDVKKSRDSAGVMMYICAYKGFMRPCGIVSSWIWWYNLLKPYVKGYLS